VSKWVYLVKSIVLVLFIYVELMERTLRY
jgi:hypothetical protein